MKTCDVSLVLPCFNEAETYSDSIQKIVNVLNSTDLNWEIILIDDCSKDSTKRLIQNSLKKYSKNKLKFICHSKNLGRGQTVIDGILEAKGEIVGFIDIDLEVNQWYLPRFIETIKNGFDVAVAWRVYDINFSGFIRWLSSKGYTWLRKIILGLPYKDTEVGYKFFKRNKILDIIKKCRYKGWFWDTEIMARIYKSHLKTAEIPVAFIRRQDKTSTVKLIPDSIRYLRDLLSFRANND